MQALHSLSPMYASLRSPALQPTVVEQPPRRASTARIAAALAVACVAGLTFDLSHAAPRHREVVEVVSARAGLKKTSSGQDVFWTSGAVTVTLDPTLEQLGPGAKDAIVAAFGAWMSSGAGVPNVTVDTTSTAGGVAMDGVNRLLVGKITNPGYEHAIALTTSYFDDSTGEMLEADTVFNSEYAFDIFGAAAPGQQAEGCDDAYDLQDIATHEAGHFFGLGEDYDDQSTTMYVSSQFCEMHKRELTKADVSVMSGLYAGVQQGQTSRAGCGGGTAVGR